MLEVAVCGAGNWGKNLVRAFSGLTDARLRTICDRSPTIRDQMQRGYPQATVTDDFDEVLADRNVHAVVLAVDAPHHYRLADAALRAGKHVFVEKPLTLEVDEAQRLIQVADEVQRKLMVGHLLEYHPAVSYLKRMVHAGELTPLYCYSQRVNLGLVRQAENAWWSLAPHDISVACYLMDDEPVSVTATGQCYLQQNVEDVVFATLTFADGRMAHIHVSWLDPHKMRKMTFVGSDKMVVFDDMEPLEKLRIYDKGADVQPNGDADAAEVTLRQGDVMIPAIAANEPLRLECEHFVQCIAEDTTPRSDGRDGLRVVRLLQAGSASLARGGEPIALSPPEPATTATA